ncbi:HD domain-containing protein, partial [Salmonella enterica]|uniref:HD domain-containing protein n=1 Tax=Salmonella enterica TaxID=28901 RepID=UPI003D2CFFC8
LAEMRPLLFRHLAGLLGWAPADLAALWTFALALHDLGKFSRAFQAKAPECWPAALGRFDPALCPPDPGHAATGITILLHLDAPLERWFPGWYR